MDIRDEASIRHGIQKIISQADRIDVLVNSAGVTLLGSVEETSIIEAQSLFDTNVLGMLRTTQAVLPHARATFGKNSQRQLGAWLSPGSVHGALFGIQACR